MIRLKIVKIASSLPLVFSVLGSTVVWWLALLPCTKKFPGSSLWSLHVLFVLVWVSSGYTGFLPRSKNMHVRLIGDSKLSVGVIVSVCVWPRSPL